MRFVRVWSPPVVVGFVVAFLGIGVAEVAGTPAGGTPVAAPGPDRNVPPRTSVAPAAIERDDVAKVAAEPGVEPHVTTAPRQADTHEPSSSPTPKPKSAPDVSPTPTIAINPKPSPQPIPSPSPTAPAPPRAAPIVRPVPTPMPALVRPAQVLDLRRWKLTLPVGRPGHPTEYRQPALGSLASGSYIRLTPDHGVAFRAPVGGVATGNSSYPRSELREMSADGQHEAGWTNAAGRHVMTIVQAITATPLVKPHVVAGQIHDAEDDVVMIRLEGRRLFVESDGDDIGLLDPAYRLGTRFTVSIAATPTGIQVVYDPPLRGSSVAAGGAPKSRSVHVRKLGRGWYFKAGCYPQSNPDRGDRPNAYGEVVIYALTVQHGSA
jgi:poly(beta-D-mannuronate) lyase